MYIYAYKQTHTHTHRGSIILVVMSSADNGIWLSCLPVAMDNNCCGVKVHTRSVESAKAPTSMVESSEIVMAFKLTWQGEEGNRKR